MLHIVLHFDKISIHALRVEGDTSRWKRFQRQGYFYPRPPGGGRPLPQSPRSSTRSISIHALRVEGDQQCPANQNLCTISIHALRVEGDLLYLQNSECIYDFYPRPPGGGRLRLSSIV